MEITEMERQSLFYTVAASAAMRDVS